LELLNEPIDYSEKFDHIARLFGQGKVSSACLNLRALKPDVNGCIASLMETTRTAVDIIRNQELQIVELRTLLLDLAIRYARLNDDPEAIQIGEELLKQQTEFMSAFIADLDPEG
jgi:hypothetical protein